MPTKHPRFSIAIPEEMYDKVEEYRYNEKYKSQNSAVIALVELGLQALDSNQSPKKEAPAHIERELTVKEQQIVNLIHFIPERIQDAILTICDATADRAAIAQDMQQHAEFLQTQRQQADRDGTSAEQIG